jgi:HNH endonuclease/NUMOD4 motif
MNNAICSIEDCGRPARTRGWCGRHYQRWCNHGDPLCLKQVRGTCSAEGCDKAHLTHGLCSKHWERRRRAELRPTPTPLDLPGERWAAVPGWEHLYEVSDGGRVRTIARTIQYITGRDHYYAARILAGSDFQGYRTVSLGSRADSVPHRVHRLVLGAFVGPCPEGMECRHLNGDRADNRLENLAWGTPHENGMDRLRHGTDVHAAQTHCMRNHLLAGPNLRSTVSPNGRPGRYCIACNRGASYIRRNRARGELNLDLQEVSDRYYAEIMANAA